MSKLETLTKNLLNKILTSSSFLNGIDEAVKTTKETGYETDFWVYKKIFGRKIAYDAMINIGNKRKVGPLVGIERIREEFRQKTRKDPVKFQDDFFNFYFSQKVGDYIDYPAPDKNLTLILDQDMKNPKYYCLLHVHTHPTGEISPSEKDLVFLNTHKKYWSSQLSFPTRQLGLIIGVERDRPFSDIILFQENNDIPLSKEDINKRYKELKSFLYKNSYALSSLIFGDYENKLYNKVTGIYNTNQKQISLYSISEKPLKIFTYRHYVL